MLTKFFNAAQPMSARISLSLILTWMRRRELVDIHAVNIIGLCWGLVHVGGGLISVARSVSDQVTPTFDVGR